MIPAAKAPTNATDWTVSELSGALKRTLEDAFGHVRVRGEIFGYKGQHASGHAYFCLKDQDAKIEAVVWRTAFSRMRVKPKEGLEVIATGRVTTFPNKSTYQVVIESLEPAGIGAWMALLEERRRALAAEGLFAAARKRALPFLPVTIGVVTSPSGAVIRDILHRLADRFPRHVLVWPVRVQGETCAAEVAAAIQGFNALAADGPVPRPDVIVVARGGGSIEDLWGFNEEIVVRAAAESAIPLVSAIGHETDTTLLDLVADRRAPTPTGAAEMIVPVRSDLLNHLDKLTRRHHAAMRREVDTRRTELRSAARALPRADSVAALARQRLDEAARGLERGLRDHRQGLEASLALAGHRLARVSPAARLLERRYKLDAIEKRPKEAVKRLLAGKTRDLGRADERLVAARDGMGSRLRQSQERIDAAAVRLEVAWTRQRERKTERLAALDQLFGSLNYRAVLSRGYALVRDEAGGLVRSADEAKTAQTVAIEFAQGRVTAAVEGNRAAPQARRKAEPRRAVQGTLFDA